MKPERYKILGHYDVSLLLSKLDYLSDHDWKQAEEKKSFYALDQCDSIVLFSLCDKDNPIYNRLMVNTNLLSLFSKEITDICNIIEGHYPNGDPKRIMLNKLPPGCKFAEHIDVKYHLETCRRVHLPIVCNDDVDFIIMNEKIPIKVGNITEINNNVPHSVENNSDLERIHLIIDWGIKDDPYYENAVRWNSLI